MSGDTEAERDKGSETAWKKARGRYRQTDRHVRAHTHAHAHTHTHREAETERGRHRATDRETENGRQTRERGWHPIRDRHTGTDRDTPQREALRKKQLPQGSGASALGRARLDAVPWGWQSHVGSPRLLHSLGLKGPLWLGYIRQDVAPAPRPEGV